MESHLFIWGERRISFSRGQEKKKSFLYWLLFAQIFYSGCIEQKEIGFLEVHSSSPTQNEFEILFVSKQEPLEIKSETPGLYNKKIPLKSGEYNILSDCSSERVVIKPGIVTELSTKRINFKAPDTSFLEQKKVHKKFSIQCDRRSYLKSKLSYNNKFELFLFEGDWDLLVGLNPVKISITRENMQNSEAVEIPLGALQIKLEENKFEHENKTSFISSDKGELSIIESLDPHQVLFLLPGEHQVELNGTTMVVDIESLKVREVTPAYLKVSTDESLNLNLSSMIHGTPNLLEMNHGHWLFLNQIYPVLPSQSQLYLSEALEGIGIHPKEGETLEIPVHSILIDLGCAPYHWNCLGSKEIRLYRTNSPTPFVKGTTDVPLLYFVDEKPIYLGIEGSRDIRFEVNSKERNFYRRLSFLKVIPEPQLNSSHISDLLRVEADHAPITGVTLDLPLDEDSLVPVIAGSYSLVHYFSTGYVEGNRSKKMNSFFLKEGETREVKVPTYLSEKKYHAWVKAIEKKQKNREDISSARKYFLRGREYIYQ